ncbi:nucleoside hydrolase [Candidatus Bathyarchaeota archaeon]|nr:MAG: nucleoside hydrolase [Candidatus Bathyarchaeota archaeon]
MVRRVILDTDIGSDVDDALALALILKSKELRLEGVTVVHGDVDVRARIAIKIMRLAGVKGVPVAKGIRRPLLMERPIFWTGHEGEGILTDEDKSLRPSPIHAIDLLTSKINSAKGEITLIAIGPLTNLAASIIKSPSIVENVKEVYIMGGVLRLFDGLALPVKEHNISCDPEAARLVFNSGIPITMVPLDVTLKVAMNRDDLKKISAVNTPLTDALASMTDRYMKFRGRDYTWLHDPLAVAASIDQGLVKTREMRVVVETRGEETTGQTLALPAERDKPKVKVCVDVDAEKFKNFFMERICGT